MKKKGKEKSKKRKLRRQKVLFL